MTITAALFILLSQAASSAPDDRERWLPPVKGVTLERAERTLGETLKAVRDQTGLDVRASEIDESAKVTVEWKERPVLAALDDLCRGIRAGSISVKEDAAEKGTIELDGQAKLPASVCHWKQFRIEYSDAVVTTTRTLESTKRSASLTLLWTAQPGTHPLSVEGFQPEEIVDDAGWSLLPEESGVHRRGSDGPLKEGEDPGAVIPEDRFHDRDEKREVQLDLRAPAPEARTIERLRGRLFMTFPMRFVEQSIPAAEMVAGKELKIGLVTIHVRKFEQRGENLTFVYRMSGRGTNRDLSSFTGFELLDEKGNKLNRGYRGSGSDTEYTFEFTLTSAAPVARLQQKAYVGRITLAVPVDLHGLPLPPKKP
jgi:hypothetical protein